MRMTQAPVKNFFVYSCRTEVREPWQDLVDRWERAGLIDAPTAVRIRDFEQSHPASPRIWAVWVALVLGGIALGAGVFLFVAAHWDAMAPPARMALLISMIAGFHACGLALRHSAPFRTLFHALGTLSVGAAIALTAQIFNIEEHWAEGTLLWAIAAATGWYLLREWPQGLMLAVLGPAWLAGEWQKLVPAGTAQAQVLLLFALMMALIYVVSGVAEEPLRMALNIAGTVAVMPAFVSLSLMRMQIDWTPLQQAGWAVALLLPVAVAWRLAVRPWWSAAIMAGWVAVLALLGHSNTLARHGWAALGWVLFLSWAVRAGSVLRVNLGIIGFAITVLTFYFSSVMDKLGRSLSLIALGILLLGGGWALDRWRRSLIASIASRP